MQESFTPLFSCLPALTPFHYVQAKSASPLLKLIIIRWAFLILTIQCGWLIEWLPKVRAQKVDFRAPDREVPFLCCPSLAYIHTLIHHSLN